MRIAFILCGIEARSTSVLRVCRYFCSQFHSNVLGVDGRTQICRILIQETDSEGVCANHQYYSYSSGRSLVVYPLHASGVGTFHSLGMLHGIGNSSLCLFHCIEQE